MGKRFCCIRDLPPLRPHVRYLTHSVVGEPEPADGGKLAGLSENALSNKKENENKASIENKSHLFLRRMKGPSH